VPRRELYPALEPYRHGYLRVSDVHEIYYEESGNPAGKPAVFLHGGPGAGSDKRARQFFDPSLRTPWRAVKSEPYDFLVQSPTWKLSAISISILRKQFDKTYVAVAFDNNGRAVTLNFILVNGPEGWLITDVESPHDSLRMFLDQFKN